MIAITDREEKMENKLFLRKTELCELDAAVRIIEDGRAYLKSQGLTQWQTGYPDRTCVGEDILAEKGWFLTDGENVMAYMCLDFSGEPAYGAIKGNWLTPADAEYLVIHRLAFDARFRGRGLASAAFSLAERHCAEKGVHSIRVDTDPENKIMQHILQKIGFTYCGTIWFAGGDKLAFEKLIGK